MRGSRSASLLPTIIERIQARVFIDFLGQVQLQLTPLRRSERERYALSPPRLTTHTRDALEPAHNSLDPSQSGVGRREAQVWPEASVRRRRGKCTIAERKPGSERGGGCQCERRSSASQRRYCGTGGFGGWGRRSGRGENVCR